VQTDPCRPFPPFVEQTESRYGPMLYPPKDQYVGRSFKEYGEFSQGELDLFTHFIGAGAIVLDIGANIGAHTIPIAQLVGSGGVVVAFEPQPTLHKILCANLVLNSIPNVLTYAMALGDCEGECLIPVLDYSQSNNFGGIGMDMVEEGEAVPLSKLDAFQLERVDFIKLDVEGFESKVLAGAIDTIARCRPIMYIENDRAEKSAELIQRCFDMGYRLWWHTPPLFSPDNFKGNQENVFPHIVSINMLAIHKDMRPIEGLKPVLMPQDTWS
jgi:FkbM family methyltransferase